MSYTCPCGMPCLPTEGYPLPYSLPWHEQHYDRHLAAFPDVDETTKDNLRRAALSALLMEGRQSW